MVSSSFPRGFRRPAPFGLLVAGACEQEVGDAVDVALLVTYPTFPGCVIKARPIGFINTADEKGEDAKIIAVPVDKLDPRFREIQSYEELPSHVQEELLLYFKEYKKLEKAKYDKIEIRGFGSREEAYKVIEESHKAYGAELQKT